MLRDLKKVYSNPVYRHMNVDRILDDDSTSAKYTTSLGNEIRGGLIISPDGVKFDGRLKSFVYHNVTVHRRNTEKYLHLFKHNNMFGDTATEDNTNPHSLVFSDKSKHGQNYTLNYISTVETPVYPEVPKYSSIPLYIEITPYSKVNIEENFFQDQQTRIMRIVYVLREGATLNLTRKFCDFANWTTKQILESRIIQHPASTVNINTKCMDNLQENNYLQDLYFVDAYRDTKTNIKCRYYTANKNSIHNIVDVNHIGPNGISDVDVKSVTEGTSKFTFAGNIKVAKEAEKVDANLYNKNLQLSKTSVVVTEPKLDISTKEISCNHGCTVSSVDPEQVYMLNTRGFNDSQANKILTDAFING